MSTISIVARYYVGVSRPTRALVRVRAHLSIIRFPPPPIRFLVGKYKCIYGQPFPPLEFHSFPSINRKLNFDSSGKFLLSCIFFLVSRYFQSFWVSFKASGSIQSEETGRLLLGKLSKDIRSYRNV